MRDCDATAFVYRLPVPSGQMLHGGNSAMMPTLQSTEEGGDGQTRQRVAQRGHSDTGAPLRPDLYSSSLRFSRADLHAWRNRHARLSARHLRDLHLDDIYDQFRAHRVGRTHRLAANTL